MLAGGIVLIGAANPPQLAALSAIESGQWELRSAAPGAQPKIFCLGDARLLLQIEHSGATCDQLVIANEPRMATVHYMCQNAGHGRTTVRVESPHLIRVDSQGISRDAPFDWSLTGRRTGDCPAATAR